ncbi:MAG: TonB-dependent receptor [Desulfatiglandaceae bacterium]
MGRMFNGLTVLFILCLGVFLTAAWAEEGVDRSISKEKGVFSLGEVVVTGEAVEEVTTVDVINREQIDLTNSNNVSDALNTLPGVFISVGNKNERNFNVRGFNERYVPVLYDGIPIYVPNDGYVDTGKLPTGNISQITVTKGVSSVLYGPNTMGGVINIVSKKPVERFEGNASVEYSQEDTWNTNFNLGSKVDKFYITAGGGYLNSDGFRLSHDFTPTMNENGGTRDNSDSKQWNGTFKAGFTPAEGQEFAVGVNHVKSERGLPPNAYDARPRYWRFTDWKKTTYYLIGDSRITDGLTAKVRAFHDKYFNVLDSYDDDTYSTETMRYAFHSTYDDHSNGGSLVLHTTYIPRNTLGFSFHYKQDVHREQDDYGADWERYESRIFSYGLEDAVQLTETVSAVLGASYDVQKPQYANGGPVRDDDTSFNPQVGISWSVLKDTSLYASVGKKTRFPTLLELYSGLFDRNVPNPNLEKEEAVNYEAGVRQTLPFKTFAEFNLYYSDVKNLIVSKELASGDDQFQNVGKARYQGFEVNLDTGFVPRNDIRVSYTYLDAGDRSPNRKTGHLEETPKHKLYVSDLFKVNDRVSLFGKATYYSKQYYEDSDTGEWKTLGGFCTADAKVIINITKCLTVEAGAKNIFDKNYELSYGFPREGRTFFGLARFAF